MSIVGSALDPIQSAIVSKLSADNTLMGMVSGVFDFRGIPNPEDTPAFPYISIGDSTETDDSNFDTLGYDTTFTLHIWSDQPQAQQCQRILARLNKLLNHQPLTLMGMSHVGTWYDYSTILGDPEDNRLTHMPVRYRIGAGENEEN